MVVPYSNHQVVVRPFGLISPVTTALVGAIEPAGPVVTEGVRRVVNVRSPPSVAPASLEATTR